jgi:hypothetical protein
MVRRRGECSRTRRRRRRIELLLPCRSPAPRAAHMRRTHSTARMYPRIVHPNPLLSYGSPLQSRRVQLPRPLLRRRLGEPLLRHRNLPLLRSDSTAWRHHPLAVHRQPLRARFARQHRCHSPPTRSSHRQRGQRVRDDRSLLLLPMSNRPPLLPPSGAATPSASAMRTIAMIPRRRASHPPRPRAERASRSRGNTMHTRRTTMRRTALQPKAHMKMQSSRAPTRWRHRAAALRPPCRPCKRLACASANPRTTMRRMRLPRLRLLQMCRVMALSPIVLFESPARRTSRRGSHRQHSRRFRPRSMPRRIRRHSPRLPGMETSCRRATPLTRVMHRLPIESLPRVRNGRRRRSGNPSSRRRRRTRKCPRARRGRTSPRPTRM